MNLFKRIFRNSNKSPIEPVKKNPENTKLNYLIDVWNEHRSDDNYMAVVDEILNGNSYLVLPTINDRDTDGNWTTIQAGETLKLTSIFNLDGLKVIAAFSSIKYLTEWSKQPAQQYTSIAASAIVQLCEGMDVGRVVINSGQKNMFVLERNINMTHRVVQKETPARIGTPAQPLGKHIIEKLIANFKKVDTIEEAYQYAQTMNNELSIVLGIKMSIVSDNSKAALYNAISNALDREELKIPVDTMIIEDDHWLQTVRSVEKAQFY